MTNIVSDDNGPKQRILLFEWFFFLQLGFHAP